MPRNIKIITTADSGGLIDMVVVLNKKLNQKGYKSSIIRINKYKNREIRNINKGDYVIFQMSGYGYHNKGLPFWLINQIKLIKKKSSCIGIHFHELNINHKIDILIIIYFYEDIFVENKKLNLKNLNQILFFIDHFTKKK